MYHTNVKLTPRLPFQGKSKEVSREHPVMMWRQSQDGGIFGIDVVVVFPDLSSKIHWLSSVSIILSMAITREMGGWP